MGGDSFFSVVETNVIFIESLSRLCEGISRMGWFMGDRLAGERELRQVRVSVGEEESTLELHVLDPNLIRLIR